MLGNISPQSVRVTSQAVVYPGRDHVVEVDVEVLSGRKYRPADLNNLTRVVLIFPRDTSTSDDTLIFDSLVDDVFDWTDARITIDLSTYAMPSATLAAWLIVYDAEHPQGQVLIDNVDTTLAIDFRLRPNTGVTAPPTVIEATLADIAAAIAAHVAESDPHTQYAMQAFVEEQLTLKVDDADYLAFVTAVNDALADRYTKQESDNRFDPINAASSAVTAHEQADDPHPQYTTAAEAAAAAPVQSVQGRTGAVVVTKVDLALDNVDNTSDANKPVSGPQQAAIDLRIPLTQKGADNGVATLDNEGKVPLSQISDAVLGQLSYQGLWDASTNTPTLPGTPAQKGDYYIASVAGTQFGIEFDVGDWLVSDGAAWGKVDNTDAVASVNGKKGVVTITKADVDLGNADNTSDANKPVSTAQQAALNLKVDKVTDKQLSTEDYTPGEKTKLGGIATAATANATDADLRDRATHTGTQAATTVTIADAGNYFAGTNAETVLQEVGVLIGDTSAALDAINGEVV